MLARLLCLAAAAGILASAAGSAAQAAVGVTSAGHGGLSVPLDHGVAGDDSAGGRQCGPATCTVRIASACIYTCMSIRCLFSGRWWLLLLRRATRRAARRAPRPRSAAGTGVRASLTPLGTVEGWSPAACRRSAASLLRPSAAPCTRTAARWRLPCAARPRSRVDAALLGHTARVPRIRPASASRTEPRPSAGDAAS